VIALAASLAACTSAAGPTPAPPAGVAGRTFLSTSITDGGVDRPLVAGTRIRLDLRDGDLTASAGCNTMGARYHVDGQRLIVEQLSMTDMGCPAALGAQDTWLAQLLGAGPTIRLDGDELDLTSGTVVVRLMDRRVADPDRPLVGTAWTLESIIGGDAVSSVPSGAQPATLLFSSDGTVTVSTGCNQGSATWTRAGTGITFADLVLTKKACAGPGAALESAAIP
jgi:heat shock protein HslJ